MTTSYPGGIDNFTNPTSTDTLSSSTVPHASEHANANDAIKAIETELGTNPKGSYASVSARLAASTGSITTWRKAASGGETSLTGTDDFSTTLAYTVGQEQVFINGVLLERGVDYTATTGSSITGLTALVASDIATVISVGTFNVANAIPLSTVTAKGDLLAATGASTVANLGVGADGSTLVANSSASTGVSWTGNQAGGKNGIINGGFDIWQRGTTVAVLYQPSTFTADRWSAGYYTAGRTVYKYATSDTTLLPNIPSCARVQRDSGNTSTATIYFGQSLENIESARFIGQTVTMSFWARKGALYSQAASSLIAVIQSGTGTDQNIITTGFTGATNVATGTKVLTTNWQKFSITGTVGTSATQLGIYFQFDPVGTAGASDYFEVTGVQLELGSAPTTFTRAGGTLQGELAACQRYYYRQSATGANVNLSASGVIFSSTTSNGLIPFPATMRAVPSSVDYSALRFSDVANVQTAISSVVISAGCTPYMGTLDVTSSGMTTGRFGYIQSSSSSGYIGFSAEL
jgi:hypothetical protein